MPRKKKSVPERIFKLITSMTLVELRDLARRVEDELGITLPIVYVVPSTNGDQDAQAEEDQTEWTVSITGVEDTFNRINVIKAVRRVKAPFGLKESKDLVDEVKDNYGRSSQPSVVILEGVSKEDAEEARKEMEEAGATVELSESSYILNTWAASLLAERREADHLLFSNYIFYISETNIIF